MPAAAVAETRKKPPPPLDRGWAWMIVVGVFIYVFFMVGLAKSYGQFQLGFRNYFGVSTAYASMPISVAAFVYAFGAPTAIILAEVITQQRVVIIGAVIGLIGISLCSLLVNIGYVIALFGISFGLGNSCFYGNGLVMIGKYFRKHKTLATGLSLAGASIGQFAMPPLIEYLMETYGLGGTLLIIAALYSHSAISGALFRPIEQYDLEQKTAEVGNNETQKVVEDTEVLLKNSQEAVPGDGHPHSNGDPVSVASNRNMARVDEDKHMSSGDTQTEEHNSTENHDATLKGSPDQKRLNDDLEEDDRSLLERRALLTSTGSIFLATPSILDVSDIDNRAHKPDSPVSRKDSSKIKRIFDFSVLKSYVTIFFTVVSFLCFFGYFNFILFLPAIVVERNITKYNMAMLISVCGAGDLISRISTGIFADRNIVPRYQIKAMACFLSGINIFVFIFADSFEWLAFHCFCYGFLGGTYVCLMSVVLVDFVGVALLAKNLAVILLIQGIGAAVGQIFLGFIRDITGTFTYVILILSLNMTAGGLLLFFYPVVRRWEDRRNKQTDKTTAVMT